MAGLWGKPNPARENALKQMREQKKGKRDDTKTNDKGHRKARRATQSMPRPKGSLGW